MIAWTVKLLTEMQARGDDLPFFVEVLGKRHQVLPYSFDTNDRHYHQGFHRFVTARLRRRHD